MVEQRSSDAGGHPPEPVARSPIPAPEPSAVVDGWLVSTRESNAELVLVDVTPLRKSLLRAAVDGAAAAHLEVLHGRLRRDADGRLVLGTGPGEWVVLAPASQRDLASELAAALTAAAGDDELVSVLDVTHGRALLRLTGASAVGLLARVCALDLTPAAFPDATVARTVVAGVVTEVARDDRGDRPSLLLSCETSSGRFLWDELRRAGTDLGLDVAGMAAQP